jgi:hypothetical protein
LVALASGLVACSGRRDHSTANAAQQVPGGAQNPNPNALPPVAAPPGTLSPVACWRGPIVIQANTLLDATLDDFTTNPAPRAAAQARLNAVTNAANAWNAELAALPNANAQGVRLVIAPVGDAQYGDKPAGLNHYAHDQDTPACQDTNTGDQVYLSSFTNPDNHANDGSNALSFGHGDHNVAPNGNGTPPGWTYKPIGRVLTGGPGSPGRYDDYPMSEGMGMDVDALGETSLRRSPPNPNGIRQFLEVDIGFHTHNRTCNPWDWAFFGVKPGTYDFYSVALHELGHALGLDHMDAPAGAALPAGTQNVMQPLLPKGILAVITASERNALTALDAICAPPAPAIANANPPAAASGAPEEQPSAEETGEPAL